MATTWVVRLENKIGKIDLEKVSDEEINNLNIPKSEKAYLGYSREKYGSEFCRIELEHLRYVYVNIN